MGGDDGKAPMGARRRAAADRRVRADPAAVPAADRRRRARCCALFGVSGKLARQNAVRNPRRTAATASALMIGLTLITGLTVIAGSVQKAIDKMAARTRCKADYIVSHGQLRPALARRGEAAGRVGRGHRRSPAAQRPRPSIDGETEYLTGVNGATIGKLDRARLHRGRLSRRRRRQEGRRGHRHRRAAAAGRRLHVRRRRTEDGKKGKLTVAGLYEGNEMIKRHHGRQRDRSTPHMAKRRGHAGHG